jgi:long-chain acyl-CoA synthetase
LISHRNIVGIIANAEAEDQIDYNSNDVYISYLPLPHVLERIFVSVMIYFGARIGFYSGDVMKLKDDL